MTKFDENWSPQKKPSANGWQKMVCIQEYEHASCGVGLVVSIDGKPSRKVVKTDCGAEGCLAPWCCGCRRQNG